MRWKRMRIPDFLGFCLLLVFVFSLAGCGGGDNVEFVLPEIPEPTPFPFEGDGRYVSEEHRLEFPTFTPVPTSTPRPTRAPLSRRVATVVPTPTPGVSSALAALVGLPGDEVLSCVDHYRRMVISYDGRVPFGPEVVGELSEDMKSARPDCVAQGWSPEFGLESVCTLTTIAGVRVREVFFRWEGSREPRPIARSTMRDDRGNIMVHFQKMPFHDGRGCWYYDSPALSWAWLVGGEDGPRSGLDRSRFPGCEKYVRDLVDSLPDGEISGGEPLALEVARAIDRVKFEFPSDCGKLWNIYPQRDERADCEVSAPTGADDEGLLIINWHHEYPASDGSICWVRSGAGGDWRILHPVVEAKEVVEPEETVVPDTDLVRAPDNPEVVVSASVDASQEVSVGGSEVADPSLTPEAVVPEVGASPTPEVEEPAASPTQAPEVEEPTLSPTLIPGNGNSGDPSDGGTPETSVPVDGSLVASGRVGSGRSPLDVILGGAR